MKLRTAQGSVARASIPVIRITELMVKIKDAPKKDLARMSMDTLTLLADANDSIGFMQPK